MTTTHHGDAISHGQGLGLVMGDIDHGARDFPVDLFDLRAHFYPQLRVEIGQRLIEQDDIRLDDQGAGERDACCSPPDS